MVVAGIASPQKDSLSKSSVEDQACHNNLCGSLDDVRSDEVSGALTASRGSVKPCFLRFVLFFSCNSLARGSGVNYGELRFYALD